MHQVIVGFGDFAFCQFTIDPRGIDVFGRFSGLTSQQVSNDDMTGSFHQTAGMEILVTAALLLESFDTGDHLLEPHAQVGQFALHGAHFGGIVRSLVGLDLLQERTFGHGIETASHFEVHHGYAVAIGMVLMAQGAVKHGELDIEALDKLKSLIEAHHLPTTTTVTKEEILAAAKHDKKSEGATIKIVVPTSYGHSELKVVTHEELATYLD